MSLLSFSFRILYLRYFGCKKIENKKEKRKKKKEKEK
jgi:hypothetical protein